MLQTQRLAKQEFLEAFNDRWPKIVKESIVFNEPTPQPESPAESPQLTDTLPSEDPSADSSNTGPQPLPSRKIM